MRTAAKIVIDVDDNSTVEIPYEYYTNGKQSGSKAKFYYVDIDEYERRVRADERKRIKDRQIKNRKETIQMSKAAAKYIWQKAVGVAIIFSSVFLANFSYSLCGKISLRDWIMLALTVPVGLFFVFSKHWIFKKM